MSEQDNYLFKVVGSIVMGYGMEKPNEETLAIANKIIDLVAQATEQRIIKLLDSDLAKCDWAEKAKDLDYDPQCEACDQTRHLIALIKGEQPDHLGKAIQATVWAYTEGEQK